MMVYDRAKVIAFLLFWMQRGDRRLFDLIGFGLKVHPEIAQNGLQYLEGLH